MAKKEKFKVLFLYPLLHNILPPNMVSLTIIVLCQAFVGLELRPGDFSVHMVSTEVTQWSLADVALCLGGDGWGAVFS